MIPARAAARRLGRPLVTVLLVLTACGPARPAPTGVPVDLTLHDFHIDAATQQVPSGRVLFHIHNAAPATHEFVVVRTNLPATRLPIASDGLSVDEDALTSVGEDSDVDAGTTGLLSLNLPPGRYVYFCNLEGHYLGGMHGVLEVTSGA